MLKKILDISEHRHPKSISKTEVRCIDIKQRKSHRCRACDTKTYQKDGICVLCKTGITQMYEELIKLLKKNREWGLLKTVMMVEENTATCSEKISM